MIMKLNMDLLEILEMRMLKIQLLGLNHHGHGKNKGKGEVHYVVLC